jgi:hypothetical protein
MPSMSSPVRERPASLDSVPPEQRPRIYSVPEYASTSGPEAIDLGKIAGITLDPWQELALRDLLGERPDGKWAAEEAGITCPRQNGKDEILVVRMLAGLFLLGERLIVCSAHAFDTNMETMLRLEEAIESSDYLSKRVKSINRANGKEGITLKGGQRVRFRARTKGGARGYSGDLVILNEAMEIPEKAFGAMRPLISARPNPQIIFAGTAVDQWQHDNGLVFARVRSRGIACDENFAYLEWSAHVGDPAEDNPSRVPVEIMESEEAWQQSNPAFGHRIIASRTRNELASMDDRTFAVERLGIGDWPSTDEEGEQLFTPEKWKATYDPDSAADDPVSFAVAVTPDRAFAAIGAAGQRPDGLPHVEVVEHKRGTGWVVDRMLELTRKHRTRSVVLDGGGPAASLIPKLEEAGIEVETISTREYGQACAAFFDVVDQETLRHLDTPELRAAVRAAKKRTLGDAWAWARKGTDATPLEAVTLALWGAGTTADSVYEDEDYGVRSFG